MATTHAISIEIDQRLLAQLQRATWEAEYRTATIVVLQAAFTQVAFERDWFEGILFRLLDRLTEEKDLNGLVFLKTAVEEEDFIHGRPWN